MQVKTRTGGHFVTLFEVWQSAPGNEADLLAILDHIPTPIVCSALGDAVRTLYINRQFERTFGYTLADIPSAGEWARRAYPDEAYRYSLIIPWQAALRQAIRDGSPIQPLEARPRCKDGQVRDVVIHTAVVGQMLLMSLTDITERKRTESRYRLLTESMLDVVWVLDADTLRFVYVSPSVLALRGYTPEEIMAEPMDAALAPESRATVRALMAQRVAAFQAGELASQDYFTEVVAQPCKDGSLVWTEVVTHFQRNDSTGHVEIYGVTRNITKRREAEEKLRLSEERHRLLAENARDVIWTMAPDGRITYVSPAVQAVRGYTPEEAMRQGIEEIHTPASQVVSQSYFRQLLEDVAAGRRPENFRGELEYRCRDGSTYWTEVFVYPVLDAAGRLQEIVGVSRDIAEHKRYAQALQQAKEAADRANQALQAANAELQRIATTDALTGAWNRRQFQHLLEVEMASAARHGSALSLLMFDVDHFKRVNDSHGHQAGDQVLVRISEVTQRHLRTEDALARWGGEEFVVLLPHSTATEAARLAERLRALVADCPMPAVGRISASYGVAQWQPGETPDSWFRRLDQALYRAKAAGRNRVELA